MPRVRLAWRRCPEEDEPFSCSSLRSGHQPQQPSRHPGDEPLLNEKEIERMVQLVRQSPNRRRPYSRPTGIRYSARRVAAGLRQSRSLSPLVARCSPWFGTFLATRYFCSVRNSPNALPGPPMKRARNHTALRRRAPPRRDLSPLESPIQEPSQPLAKAMAAKNTCS